jgi:hypothetical protein
VDQMGNDRGPRAGRECRADDCVMKAQQVRANPYIRAELRN